MKSILVKRLEARERRADDATMWGIMDLQDPDTVVLRSRGRSATTPANKPSIAMRDIENLDKKIDDRS